MGPHAARPSRRRPARRTAGSRAAPAHARCRSRSARRSWDCSTPRTSTRGWPHSWRSGRPGGRTDERSIDDSPDGSLLQCSFDKIVAVKAFALHREEQLARLDGARVDGVALGKGVQFDGPHCSGKLGHAMQLEFHCARSITLAKRCSSALRASSSVALLLRTRKASRVRSGTPSHDSPQS